MMKKYQDRSKAKTIFNYTCKTLLSMISEKFSKYGRGLPFPPEANTKIEEILESLEKASNEYSYARYQKYLNVLIDKIRQYAQEKDAQSFVTISDYPSISNTQSFIGLCEDCLRSSYELSCAFWTEGDYNEEPLNSLIAQRTQSKSSSIDFTQDTLSDKIIQETTPENTQYTNENINPINIDDADRFKKEFKIGFLLSELRFNKYTNEETATLKTLITEDEYNRIFNEEQFDFKRIRFAFFFKDDLPFSCIAGLGYICGHYSHMHGLRKSANPALFNSNFKEDILSSLNSFPSSLIPDKEQFISLLDEICNWSDSSQCENVMRFLNPSIYDDDEIFHKTVRNIVENGIFNYDSVSEVKQYLEGLRKCAQIISDSLIVASCDWLISKIDDETFDNQYYAPRRKHRVWASNSLWSDGDYFENICMDFIEVIATQCATRSAAIQESKHILDACKAIAKERDIQIYERVYLEFNIATDAEYKMLRKQLKND